MIICGKLHRSDERITNIFNHHEKKIGFYKDLSFVDFAAMALEQKSHIAEDAMGAEAD